MDDLLQVVYIIVRFVHTLLTIVAVGFNMSYGIWIKQAKKDADRLRFVLRGIKLLDDRFANPAYILLMVTGVIMVPLGGFSMSEFWLWFSTVLWFVIIVVAYAAYTPALRRQIEAVEAHGSQSEEYIRAAARVRGMGAGLAITVIVILYLMIFKPVL